MPAPAIRAVPTPCRLCSGDLDAGADIALRLCSSCLKRPEGKRLAAAPSPPPPATDFTAAERGLIRSLHREIPIGDLLRLLNVRRIADLGPDAPRHALARLEQEVRGLASTLETPADWSGLRRVIADARRSGLLARITPVVIQDFAVIFSLTPAQVLHLKDVIANALEVV